MSRLPIWRAALAAGLILTLALFAALPAAAYEGYHTFADVEKALQSLAKEHSGLVKLHDIGTSAGGKKIWVAQIAASGSVAPEDRPAVFVGANVAGYHNVGTEAALSFLQTLLADAEGDTAELLKTRTFYVAPVLHPDAHDGLFASVRVRRGGNAMTLDHDRDGLDDEDGFDDLDGDGRITYVRIADPRGAWLPHPKDPRVMVRQDAKKGWIGAYRVESEGRDDDRDGKHNEDPTGGIALDHSFPHAFPFPDQVEAGPWSGYAPETKAIFDFFFPRPQIAVAVIYGPANNLLELPQSLGGGGDLGSQKFKVPEQFAGFLGLDAETEYTLDEVWEAAKDLPMVRQGNVTKEQLGQFLGAGGATKLEDNDQKLLESLAKDYKKRLEEAELDKDRPVRQYTKGGLTPWLYYQVGTLALELDVWGIPKPKKEKKEGEEGKDEEKKLTLESLAEMSAEEFLEFSPEEVTAFMKEAGVPAQFTAARAIGAVQSGQMKPAMMAQMIKSQGSGGGDDDEEKDDPQTQRHRDVLAWLDANHPEAVSDWTEVSLGGGKKAQAGGIDPFAELAPPKASDLEASIRVHTETILDLAGRIASLEIASLEAEDLGGGVYRVKAQARNTGKMASHTQLAVRSRARLPIRMELEIGNGVELVTGRSRVSAERLEQHTGTLEGHWLVTASPGATLRVRVHSEASGSAEKTHTLARGGA